MDKKLIGKLVDWLINLIDEDMVKRALDAMFDAIENKVQESENKFDDRLVLPAIALLRRSLTIPDNDDIAG